VCNLPEASDLAPDRAHLHGEGDGGDEGTAEVGPLEAGDPTQLGRLGRLGERVLDLLAHHGVLVPPVVAVDVTYQLAEGPLGLVVLALLVQPDGGLGEQKQDRQPDAEDGELGVKRAAVVERVGLERCQRGLPHELNHKRPSCAWSLYEDVQVPLTF
jgi:hypothetical protein